MDLAWPISPAEALVLVDEDGLLAVLMAAARLVVDTADGPVAAGV